MVVIVLRPDRSFLSFAYKDELDAAGRRSAAQGWDPLQLDPRI